MRTSPLVPAPRPEASRRRPSHPCQGAGSFAEHLHIGDQGESGPVTAADPAATLLALLDVQEMPGAGEGRQGRRRAALSRSDALLQRLEGLRTDLLDGRIAPARLRALAQALREERLASDDPDVEAVLDEIELRAAVELAKQAADAA